MYSNVACELEYEYEYEYCKVRVLLCPFLVLL